LGISRIVVAFYYTNMILAGFDKGEHFLIFFFPFEKDEVKEF
jgi:hypothetical protein